LPYKDVDSLLAAFGCEEVCVKNWLESLKRSWRNYGHYFLTYREWFIAQKLWSSAEEVLADWKPLNEEDRLHKHVKTLKGYVGEKGTGTWDKRNTWSAVRNFYEFHECKFPLLSRLEAQKLFSISERDIDRATEFRPLQLEQVRDVIEKAKMPYSAIYAVMFQAAMGLAEFQYFNEKSWPSVVQELDKPGPVMVPLIRMKTSRDLVHSYFSFISTDAKKLVKDWLIERKREERRKQVKIDLPHLFVVWRKRDRRWVPVSTHRIGVTLTETAMKAGLIEKGPNKCANRYPIHCHEFRDLVKSLASAHGVKGIASEYILGHDIDKLKYDKMPRYHPEILKNEYRKLEPFLNVISNPPRAVGKDDVATVMNKQFLRVFGYKEVELEKVDLAKLTTEQLRELIQKKQIKSQKQDVIPARDLKKWVDKGATFIAKVGKKVVISLPPS
jgi:hypothetical protein